MKGGERVACNLELDRDSNAIINTNNAAAVSAKNPSVSAAYLNNGAFSGASALKHIVILKKHDAITVSANLLDGAASGAKVYVLPEYYSDYVSYYTWGAFSSKIAKYE